MLALAVVLTILLLFETLPSAAVALAAGDRGRQLGAYLLFAALALAVLVVDAIR